MKLGLGKNKTGAEITLADSSRPQCLVPFSYYIGDVPAFEERVRAKLTDLRYKKVLCACTSMAPATMGTGIKLEGELQLDLNLKEKESK